MQALTNKNYPRGESNPLLQAYTGFGGFVYFFFFLFLSFLSLLYLVNEKSMHEATRKYCRRILRCTGYGKRNLYNVSFTRRTCIIAELLDELII